MFQNTYMVGMTPLTTYEADLKMEYARMHTYLIRGVELRNLEPPAANRSETIAHAMIVQGQATWDQLQRLMESLPGDTNMRWGQQGPTCCTTEAVYSWCMAAWTHGRNQPKGQNVSVDQSCPNSHNAHMG